MKKIKIILLIGFSFLLLSCDCENKLIGGGGSDSMKSVIIDNRCVKIQSEEAKKLDREKSAILCAKKPGIDKPVDLAGDQVDLENNKYMYDFEEYYLTPNKCRIFWQNFLDTVNKRCASLPPPGPGDIDVLSGNAFFKDGKLVAVDGEPVCN